MSRHPELPDAVRQSFVDALGSDDVQLVEDATTTGADGRSLRILSASSTGAPNKVLSFVLDEAGLLEPLVDAEARLGRTLRVFDEGSVPERPRPSKLPVTIDPTTNDFALELCSTWTEHITVTVPVSGATPKADVYLLSDTTGSMGSVIDAVKAGVGTIVGNPALAGFDVAYGVGNYRDFPIGEGFSSYAFAHQLAPTNDLVQVNAAVSTWAADEGQDTPEGQLWALNELSTSPAIGWRSDARRILVWFGDAPGHDPVCAAISGAGADVTEASATAALQAADITVVAISTTTGVPLALDDDPTSGATDYGVCGVGGAAGQATRITAATAGSHTTGIDAGTIVDTLTDLIEAAVTSTGNVSLVPTGQIPEFVESINPAGGYGPLPGDEEHVLGFDVTWRGTRECAKKDQVFEGTLDVVADGVVVASKQVRIVVPACKPHYVAEMVCGVSKPDREEHCVTVVPGQYATAVTIYNPSNCTVLIEKSFAPLVVDGKVIGREPETQPAKPFARIKLGPHEATMDDCCSLREALGADPEGLTLGVLDIVSSRELVVTAIYTAGQPGYDAKSGPAIDTRRIEATWR
jgi:hypothetical protein